MHRRRIVVVALVAAALGVLPRVGGASTTPTTLVFNGEGNRLNVYEHPTGKKQTLIWSAEDGDKGDGREVRDINAQICFHEFKGDTYFIAGEDTAQNGEEGAPGWGWFRLTGDSLESLRTTQRGKLVTTYQNKTDNPENYGCGFLDNGNLLLTDVGDQRPGEEGNGQLHLWFPDRGLGFARDYRVSPSGVPLASTVHHCKIDTTLATAGGIWVDNRDPSTAADDVVYVASARPGEMAPPDQWGIWRYDGLGRMGPDCHAQNSGLRKTLLIPGGIHGFTPNAAIESQDDTLYVASVFDGVVGEFTKRGDFVRHLVGPAPIGQVTGLLPEPLAGGTPFGLGQTPDGWVYYADIGVVGDGPNRPGRLMRFKPGSPPEIVDENLAFPDGIGILVLD